jgi:DNA-binding MarR family transcriptional regulator
MSEAQPALEVGAAIIRLSTAVGERVLEVRAASGLSALQLQVLRITADGATMSTLARTLAVPKSTVTSVVDQLEAMGLAVRAADVDDRRRQIVSSTAAGAAKLRDFDSELAGRIDRLLANLSPARANRLRELMKRLPDATVPFPLAESP